MARYAVPAHHSKNEFTKRIQFHPSNSVVHEDCIDGLESLQSHLDHGAAVVGVKKEAGHRVHLEDGRPVAVHEEGGLATAKRKK